MSYGEYEVELSVGIDVSFFATMHDYDQGSGSSFANAIWPEAANLADVQAPDEAALAFCDDDRSDPNVAGSVVTPRASPPMRTVAVFILLALSRQVQ